MIISYLQGPNCIIHIAPLLLGKFIRLHSTSCNVYAKVLNCVLAIWDCSRRIWIGNYEADPECPT
jgi:hypothetical protein